MDAATSAEAQKCVTDIQNCKKQVEDSIAKSPGGLSSQTLKEFTECLSKVDQDVVEAILLLQGNVINDMDLRNLVKEYFEASLETLEFLNEVENCLRVLENSHTHLLIAINKYEKEEFNACVESLKKFEANGDPFQEKFYPMFDELRERQKALLDKVTKMHDESVKKRKKMWDILFSIIVAAASIVDELCLAMIATLPPAAVVAVAVAGACLLVSCIIMARTEDERYKNREELTKKILASTTCIREELANLHIFADTLSKQIVSLKENTHEAILDPHNLHLIIEPVKGRTEEFRKDISQLTLHARKCKEHILNGRDKVAALISKFT